MHQFTESSLPPKKLAQGPVDILCVKVLPKKRSSKLVYYDKATEIKKERKGRNLIKMWLTSLKTQDLDPLSNDS